MSDWVQGEKETIREDHDAVIRRQRVENERLRTANANMLNEAYEYRAEIERLRTRGSCNECWTNGYEAGKNLQLRENARLYEALVAKEAEVKRLLEEIDRLHAQQVSLLFGPSDGPDSKYG